MSLHAPQESPTLRAVAVVVFVAGMLLSVAAVQQTWNGPILEAHSFRQTQTALTAYWLHQGGPFFAYQTPVLGAPWVLPFELPVYQLVVAKVHGALGIPLDAAGRLVSWGFFLLMLWQLGAIVRKLGDSRHLALLVCGLVLLSPMYVFWSRTFMIESTALFFSVAFVSTAISHVQAPRVWTAVAMSVLASLAALVKVTTFPVFGLVAGLVVLWDLRQRANWRDARRWLGRYAPVALAGLFAVVVVALWVRYSDAQKVDHPFGKNLTADKLRPWNYGTMAQRTSPVFWRDAVFGRTLQETLGGAWPLWATLVAALAIGRAALAWAALALVLYLIPYLVFTNLHWIHNYYQYANALFLLSAVGLVVWLARAGWRRYLALALLAFVVGSQVLHTARVEWPQMVASKDKTDTLLLRQALRGVPEDGVLLIFGFDFSSEVAYYAQRRAITVPGWTSVEQLRSVRTQPQLHAGGLPIVAVIECPHGFRNNPEMAPLMDAIMAEHTRGKQSSSVGICTLWR